VQEGRWEDNIKIDPREIGWNGMDWFLLALFSDEFLDFMNTIVKFRIS
jgi:hypothetical protein